MSRAKTAEELRAAVEALVRQYIEQGQQAALEGLERGLSGRKRVARKRARRAKNKPRAVRSAAALASLRQVRQGHGHLIHLGSLASLAPAPGLAIYSASKFAVRAFCLAAAGDLRPQGVKISVLMPDAVDTPMLTQQETFDEAALTFSGIRTLQVEDIEKAIFRGLIGTDRIELALPFERGLIARWANLFPAQALRLAPLLTALGRRRQAARQKGRS